MAKKPAIPTKGAHMWAEVLNGYWHDVGKPMEYMEVIHDIAEGRLGPDMQKKLLENNYDKGVMYWPETQEKAQADRAVLRGSVVVANRPDTAQAGAKLDVAA
jgi:NDP-sugar pyrophosphorylase family protein